MTASKSAYAASCNPARRAKRLRSESLAVLVDTDAPVEHPILPKQTITPDDDKSCEDDPTFHPSVSASPKRGRKPGVLSRAAREAQRKLNHSIIEKARRTKINDALTSLKQLVPADYGQRKPTVDDDDNAEDGDDGDYKEGLSKQKRKEAGKKEEREKDFKLEILVRTVSFMQDLLDRVAVLEAAAAEPKEPCVTCSSSKRKRSSTDDGDDKRFENDDISSDHHFGSSRARLPSISSWLPSASGTSDISLIDPTPLLSRCPTSEESDDKPITPYHSNQFYLPSPPSSTRFAPKNPSTELPVLNLGPIASQAQVPRSPMHTPEDETAASLLLQIRSFSSLPPLVSEGRMSQSQDLHDGVIRSAKGKEEVQAQTPASMLGLTSGLGAHLRSSA